jgi:hypothetical protein
MLSLSFYFLTVKVAHAILEFCDKAVPSHFAKTKTKLSFAFAFAKYRP